MKFKKFIMICCALSLTSLFTGCTYVELVNAYTYDITMQNVDTLVIIDDVSNIDISKSETDKIYISCNASTERLSEAQIKTELSGYPKVENNIIYLENPSNKRIGGLDYDIELPDYIKNIKIVSGVGNIDISDVGASFDIEVDTGNIEMQNIDVLEYSNVYIDTGKLEFDARDISKAKVIFNNVDTGKLDCTIPKNSQMILDTTKMKGQRFSKGMSKESIKSILLDETNFKIETETTIIGNKVDTGKMEMNNR